MDKFRQSVFTAFVIALLSAPGAFAQSVAAYVDVVSGNGQLFCPLCTYGFLFVRPYPMVVRVTDINHKPIANKTVNWKAVNSLGAVPSYDAVTVTDPNGIAYSRLDQYAGSGGVETYWSSLISATADNVAVSFTESQALKDSFGQQLVATALDAPVAGTSLTGPAGGKGSATAPIKVRVYGGSRPIPNVSVRILSPDRKNQPSASCDTGPGADPGSVLTDANGEATCNPVFGPVPGSGQVQVLIGGLDPAQFNYSSTPLSLPLDSPVGYFGYDHIPITVTPVVPTHVSIVSGNLPTQNINPGASSAPLVVDVTDATGNVTIPNEPVTWTVISGAATVSQASTTTDSNGQAATTVILSPSAFGQITVRAALTGSGTVTPATFTLNTNVQVGSVAKVSGDPQIAQELKDFAAPLVVQVNATNGQLVVGQAVNFAVTSGAGSATLSSTSVLTDGFGRAQVSVTAGTTPGTVTVSASIGKASVAFTLTVVPPGPALTPTSFYSAGGGLRIGAVSPCSLVTVIATGLAAKVQGLVLNTNAFGPWADRLVSDTVTVNNVAAPIYSVGNLNGAEQLTFQVPCETPTSGSVPITIGVSGGTATISFPVQVANPGIFETLMSDGIRRGVVIRPDGSFVTLENPARQGEVVRVFVTGLGPTIPALTTGTLPLGGADATIDPGTVVAGIANGGTRVVSVRASPNLIGVFEIAFEIPSDGRPGLTGNDVVLSVTTNVPGDTRRDSNGSKIPVQ